uniref:Serine/arginine repetitive matrix protein 2 n=2 Tax=Fundulus heteroclitus TaxID=8078 RepID=A0A3Q2PPX0_FUNHE
MLEENKTPGCPQQSKTSTISRDRIQNFEAERNTNTASANGINPPQSFSLLLENCAPCPAPGPLTSPLLGGLPGSSPVTGRQAASLQLAHLKAQLALTQMNNVLAIGAAHLTANANAPAPCLPTKPPSPTAVAINLLNLLKIANNMSHPRFNPFAPGKQISPQGPYGGSAGQMERDPRRPPSHPGSGPGFSSSGSSSLNRGPPGGPIPSLLSLQVNFRPDRSKITVDEDIDRCLDLNISRARDEAMQSSPNQNSQFSNVQIDTFPSSNTGRPSYLTPPAAQGKRPFSVDSSSSSLDWLPICQRASEEKSSNMYSPAPSSFQGGGDSGFGASGEGNRPASTPGLGQYNMSTPAKSAVPREAIRPKYTSESASNILLHFGLEKEDLEHLISFPEDQITPENLPFILRQIRTEKAERGSGQPKGYGEDQRVRGAAEKDKMVTSMGPGLLPDQISSAVPKQSQVIDYGHTGKYTTGAGEDAGRAAGSSAMTGGSSLYADPFARSHAREPPPLRGAAELKTGPPVSPRGQMSVDSSRSSVAQSSSDPSNNQTSKPVFPSFGLLSKYTDLRQRKPDGAPPTSALKQPAPAPQAPAATQPSSPSCNLVRGVHPGRPGLVLIHRNDARGTNQSNAQGAGLRVPEQTIKPAGQQRPPPPPPPPAQTQQHRPPFPLFPQAPKPAQPRGQMPATSTLIPIRPALPSPAAGRVVAAPSAPPPAARGPKMGLCKLPTSAMMQDYTAATPRAFPHTCCLCMKECKDMKDWLSHQNTSLHLESCKLLRGQYPDWDGNTLDLLSAPGQGGQPSPATHGQNLQNRHQKTVYEARSRSASPRRQRGSDNGKEKQFSRSRSRSPPRHYGSESKRQKWSSRSRSRSPHRHQGQREARSSRSPYASRHSRRSRSRSYERPTSSRHRSRSRSYERRSPPRKREAKWSPPRRSLERRPSPRRSDEKRLSPRRSRERRSSAERPEPQRTRSRSADRLAKRLLETTAVQSLSKTSDLEAMVKTLAPALLAELAKMKSSSSSTEKKTSTKATKATTSRPKTATSSSLIPPASEPLSPDKVRISSVSTFLSHTDIINATARFGEVRDLVLCRTTLRGVVQFEKEEDAEKLKRLRSFQVKGLTVYVDQMSAASSIKPLLTKEQQAALRKKLAESRAKSQKAKSSPAGGVKTPGTSGAKNTATGKQVTKAKGVPAKGVAGKKSNMGGKNAAKSVEQKAGRDDPKSANAPSEAAKVLKQSDPAAGERDQGKVVATQAKDLAPESETSTNTEKAETQPDTLALKELKSKPGASSEGKEACLALENAAASDKMQAEGRGEGDTAGTKVEEVEAGVIAPAETVEVVSSAESKETLLETSAKPAASVKTPPRVSAPKTSTDPPRPLQTTVKAEERPVKDASPVQQPKSESPAEKLKTKTEQQKCPAKTETKQEEAEGHRTAEPAGTVLAVKSEEPAAAEAKPADGAAVTEKMEDEETREEEKKCTLRETAASSLPSSGHPDSEERTQTRAPVSPPPAASAENSSLRCVKAESTVSDTKAVKNETKVVAEPTVSRESVKKAEKKQPPRAPVSAAEKQTPIAPSAATAASVTGSDKSEENDAELPHIDEDIFKAITAALREHRLKKGQKTSEDKESDTTSKTTSEGIEEENASPTKDESEDECRRFSRFDELDFSFGDFVTVDEISEEMEETAVEETCSSSEETEGQSTDVSSATRKAAAASTEDCESPASSSSTSVKGGASLISTSVPENKQTRSSELDKSASGGKTPLSTHPKAVETPPSSGQKAQSSKRKPPTRPSEPASSGPSTRSSVAAVKPSAGTQQAQKKAVKPTKSAAAKPDHKVPVESRAANTVESEMKAKTEKSQPAEGRGLQIQSQEADLKDESGREVKETKKEMESKSTEEEIGQNENDQVLDSLNEKEEQKDEDNQDRRTETQTPGPEQDRLIHPGGLQGSESADKDKTHSDECNEMETEDQAATADDGDDGPSRTQVSENDETKGPEGPSVRGTSARDQVTSEDAPNEDEILLAEKVCETSKEVGQISNEEGRTLENKDTLKDQKPVGPSDLRTKADDEPSAEEVYQVIDSLEDQPSTAETGSETEKKEQTQKEGATPFGDDRVTRQGRSRGRTSKSEEKEQSTKKLEKTPSKQATRPKDVKAEKEGREDFEDVVYEVVDSIEDDSVQETPATENSGRRRSARGHKNAEKTPTPVEKGDREGKLDSTKEKGSGDRSVVTRSTRGRKEVVSEKAEENALKKEDKPPARRRPTPARDSQEKDREKPPQTDARSPKESAPTKKTDARHVTEGEATYEVLDAVEGELVEPTTKTPRRGRPKKDNKTGKKTDVKKAESPIKAVEEAATYEVLDSVEEESDVLAPLGQLESAGKSTVSVDDDTTTARSPSDEEEEEEEPIYQILDSLEDDQFQEETSADTPVREESETAGDPVRSGPSAVEPSEQTGGEEEEVLVRSADEPSEVKGDPSAKGSEARKKGGASKQTDKSSLNKPSSHVGAPAKKTDTEASNNVLVNLDQVSEEEEDYPDDTAEEEELKKRQAAARKREKDNEKERETRERRSRSSSSRGGGEGGRGKEEVCPGDLEKGELDAQDLVTLDEVGEDEGGEEAGTEAPTWAGDITEGELQELITLDEIAEEEEGAQNQQSPSADSPNPESSSAVTEPGQAEDKKDDEDDAKEPSSSSKRKCDDTREESGNFVTVDEVGEEKQEAKARGRPRKRSRQTQVRKSARGKNAKEEQQSLPPASLDPCPTPDSCTSAQSADALAESQRTEKEKSAEAAAAADRQPLSDSPDEQKVEGVEAVEQEQSSASFKVGDKRRQEHTGPKAKRSRSQSPSVAVDLQRPLFNPRNPRGQEFVVPKSGFFCELCSDFYLSENVAKEMHCSSQKHHDNLMKHYQKLQGKRWGRSTQSIQGCLSD